MIVKTIPIANKRGLCSRLEILKSEKTPILIPIKITKRKMIKKASEIAAQRDEDEKLLVCS
jgi:hypothetical protein